MRVFPNPFAFVRAFDDELALDGLQLMKRRSRNLSLSMWCAFVVVPSIIVDARLHLCGCNSRCHMGRRPISFEYYFRQIAPINKRFRPLLTAVNKKVQIDVGQRVLDTIAMLSLRLDLPRNRLMWVFGWMMLQQRLSDEMMST